jgi:anthranilate synthase component II
MNKLQSPKTILIIDNYDSFTYNLYQIVAQHCNAVQVIRNDKISIEEVKQMAPAGIILSPGPGRPEEAGICVELIQSLAHQIPILGVCLGHQAIAVAFGAKVVVMNEVAHGKKTTVFHQGQHLFQSMPLPFVAGRYHSLGIERDSLPSSLLIQAENDQRIIMAIKHCELPTYGVQFHPESILTPEGNRIVEQFLKVCDLATT